MLLISLLYFFQGLLGLWVWFFLFVNDPPFVILDQIFSTFDDGVKIVLIWIHLTDGGFGSESSVLEYGQQLYFFFGKIWMPEINDQNDPGLVTLMPSLMFKTIIKNICFSFFLLPDLIPYTHATILNT